MDQNSLAPRPQKPNPPHAKSLWFSIDGSNVRVTLANGGVAIIGETPRTLEPMYWRPAIATGSVHFYDPDQVSEQPDAPQRITRALLKDDVDPNDPRVRSGKIAKAMRKAMDDEVEEAFIGDGRPNLKWLSAKLGFEVDSDDRNAIWPGVKANYDADQLRRKVAEDTDPDSEMSEVNTDD